MSNWCCVQHGGGREGGGVCGEEGCHLKKKVCAPQAAVEADPAGTAVVQAFLQVLQGGPAGPLLHLCNHVLRAAWHHSNHRR